MFFNDKLIAMQIFDFMLDKASNISSISVASWFHLFLIDFYRSNIRFSGIQFHDNIQLFIQEFIIVQALIIMIAVYCSWILSKRRSIYMLLLCECLAVWMVCLPYYAPFSAIRLFIALLTFASGLTIHARVCSMIYNLTQLNNEKKTDESHTNVTSNNSQNSFVIELINTFYLNLYDRLTISKHIIYPTSQALLYLLSVALLSDVCTFLMREWIPIHITLSNQQIIIAFVGGVWVMHAMDLLYCISTVIYGLIGIPFPIELMHCHPLMSSSISEFWGIRWNPIVSKLLQVRHDDSDDYYDMIIANDVDDDMIVQ